MSFRFVGSILFFSFSFFQEDLRRCTLKGERQTWPRLSLIQVQTHVEKTLEQCVRRLRSRKSARLPLGTVHGTTDHKTAGRTTPIEGAAGRTTPIEGEEVTEGLRRRSGSVPDNLHSSVPLKNTGRPAARAVSPSSSTEKRRSKNAASPPLKVPSSGNSVKSPPKAPSSTYSGPSASSLMPRVLSWLSTRGSADHLDDISEEAPSSSWIKQKPIASSALATGQQERKEESKRDGGSWWRRSGPTVVAPGRYGPEIAAVEEPLGSGDDGYVSCESPDEDDRLARDEHAVPERPLTVSRSEELLNDEVDEVGH